MFDYFPNAFDFLLVLFRVFFGNVQFSMIDWLRGLKVMFRWLVEGLSIADAETHREQRPPGTYCKRLRAGKK